MARGANPHPIFSYREQGVELHESPVDNPIYRRLHLLNVREAALGVALRLGSEPVVYLLPPAASLHRSQTA